jgi:hypothetical protein
MPNVYVEARPKGRPENNPIEDYVVEDHADHVLATFKDQGDAIAWPRKEGHKPLVAGSAISATRRTQITGEPPSGRAIICSAG